MRLRKNTIAILFVLVLLGGSIWALADKTIDIGGFERGAPDAPLGLRLGLDLQGGTHLVYRADDPNVTEEQMGGLVDVIERRINAFGVSEPLIQKKGNNEIVIQLPGVKDIEEAKRLIGGTAQLDFRQCTNLAATSSAACPSWEPATAEGSGGVVKHLTGEFLRPTSAVTSGAAGLPEVSFQFNGEGGRMFEEITRRLLLKPLGIFLDGRLISAPVVQSVISDTGRITGLGRSEARLLAIQLNAGALPVSIQVVRESDVSATLGKDSLDKSYIAGAIGLGLVLLFMVLHYRMLGVAGALSLGLYTILVLAIFKMFNVTLTLSGIAAFVVSIGMADDANVLIFERTREELRAGRTLVAAIETGFDRAWAAIWDSNITTIVAMVIMWWFGDQLGEPRVIGFAVTMIIGVIVSMVTAVFVSRALLRVVVNTPLARNITWFVELHHPAAPRPALGP